ncbi:MAG TPA: hypothetical protein GXX75_21280 [Clostridiales bacterium]|nr:hypothetical protein [Clostridiales bacterium]
MDNNKRITAIGLALIIMGLTACSQKQMDNPYGNIVAGLGDNAAYAFLEMDYKYNVMVTSDGIYDEGEESQAAIYCDVYYYTGGEVKKLGTIMSDGTAYPVSFSKDGIFVASGHSVGKYVISEKEGILSLEKGVYEKFDSFGNPSYTIIANGIEMESTESEYQEMQKEYAASQIIHFSYGSNGSINEIRKW